MNQANISPFSYACSPDQMANFKCEQDQIKSFDVLTWRIMPIINVSQYSKTWKYHFGHSMKSLQNSFQIEMGDTFGGINYLTFCMEFRNNVRKLMIL